MPCLYPYLGLFLRLSSRLIIIFSLVLYLLPSGAEGAQPQNVSLVFPVFNSSMFSCTGIPSIVAYPYCTFNTSLDERAWVSVLPPTYNNLYPNQAARMMYRTPIAFRNAGSSIIADWSTFMLFRVDPVPNQSMMGSGLAFLISPEIDTPADSASGGFGLFSMDAATGLPTAGTNPMVIAVEFDTQLTAGIDVLDVPHIGIDVNSLVSTNASYVGTQTYDTGIGLWVDYNNTLKILAVSYAFVDAIDGSAELKPAIPTMTLVNFSSATYINQQAYIGISAGAFSGGFEFNKVEYWTFQTFGFPSSVVAATWYQWWKGVSATKKVGLVAGAAVGTILGAYACSECLFFCFFQRIKNPATAAEQRWPVRRRTSLPGTKPKPEPPPRRKVRDSLSVAKPLDLWSAPPGADGEPAIDFSKRPESDLKAMADFDDSSDEGFGDPELNLDQNWDEHALDPAEPADEVEPPATDGEIWEEAPPEGETESSPAEEKAGPPVDMPESPDSKKHQEAGTKLGIKTNLNDAPLIEKKPSQAKMEAPAPNASKVTPGTVNLSSTKQTSAEKPGAAPAEKAGAAPAAKAGSSPQQRPPQAGKTSVAPQAEKPGSEQRPSQAGKTVVPQAVKPGSPEGAPQGGKPPQQRPPQAGKTSLAPQAEKPGSPSQDRPSQARKTVPPQATKPGSPLKEEPSPDKQMAPQATKPGSPPKEKPSPVDKKMAPQATKPGSPESAKPGSSTQERPTPAGKSLAPQTTKPGSPQPVDIKMAPAPQPTKPGLPEAAKPGSPTQERPSPAGKSLAPQAAKPGSEPQHKPSPVDKTTVRQAAKPGSQPEQQKPSQPVKTAAPQAATKPGSKPEPGPQKVAPQAVVKKTPPAGATAGPQISPPQGGGASQVPRKEPPKAPRPSPQTSPPKAASPQTSPKAPLQRAPQSSPKK